MVGPRWDGDERGEGVADATGFVAGVFELVDAMRSPSWVAEEPGVHLLPHIERACRTLLLEVEDARLSADGSFDVRLSWTGQGWRVGEIRAAVFALVGSFAEIATYVRQRRVTENRDETLLFEIVTGISATETTCLPRTGTRRRSACRRLRSRGQASALRRHS
jgi:hypothetical protein